MTRLRAAVGLLALSAMLAAVPAAQAQAGGVNPLPSPALEELLGEATLGGAGIPLAALDVPALATILTEQPAIGELETVKGLKGSVAHGIEEAIEEVGADEEELEELVGAFGLAFDLEGHLEAIYEASPDGQKAGAPEFEEAVEKALGKSPEQAIDEGLEALSLGELLSRLLNRASDPSALIGEIFGAAEQESLDELVGASLSGAPFSRASVGEVAAALGETPTALAETFGAAVQLPEAATALTALVKDGRDLSVFAATKGLDFALIGTESSEPPSEPGGGGTPPAPVIPGGGTGPVATTPATGTPPPPPPTSSPSTLAPGASTPANTPKVKILSHRVKGDTVTVLFQLPAAGRLVLRGSDVKLATRTIARAGHASLTTHVTAVGIAALRKHHRLAVKLRATFTPMAGTPSAATITVELR
jgi:hypothetical protein